MICDLVKEFEFVKDLYFCRQMFSLWLRSRLRL